LTVSGSEPDVHEGVIGDLPCLIAGEGPPLVVLAGLSPDTGVSPGPMRRVHEQALSPWLPGRRVFYLNRRAGLPPGMTMATLAAEHAAGLNETFGGPVDLVGMSTGGSIAQQLAADHPDAVSRLLLVSTACRLGSAGRRVQRQVAARVRAGASRQALAVAAAEFVPPWRGRYLAALVAGAFGPRLFAAADLQDLATTIEAEDGFDLAACGVVRSPTLLIAGAEDRFYERELFVETAALIPDCRLSLYPNRGHVTVTASPRAIAEATGFLNAGRPTTDSARPASSG
jgi:pimeloyl-ACP methyl ester carboxylesterase